MQPIATCLLSLCASLLTAQEVPHLGQDYEGMMEALADIQENGDDMMAGIWWQKDILGKLESSLEEAERRMTAVERRNSVLEQSRASLQSEVEELEKKKSDLLSKLSEEEMEVARTRVSLQPLDTELMAAKSELGSLTLDVTSKQKELQEIKSQLQSSKTTVSLSTTPVPILLVLAISLIINIVVGLRLSRHLVTQNEREEVALYGEDWINKVLALSAKRVKRKQNKKPTKGETAGPKEKETKIKTPSIRDWSSDFFDKFSPSEFNIDWMPSHQNPLEAGHF